MREIKFRAWDPISKKMIIPKEFIQLDKLYIGYFDESGYPKISEDFILMQYTGVNDKNKKEIYEGDVIVQKHGEIKGVVRFRDGVFGVDTGKAFYPFPAYKDIEIIGNIHENPELLKEVIK